MTITRPGSSTRMGAIAVLLLLAALPGESRADSECPGKGSTGCWASACVFTPEALRHLIAETGPGQIMIGTDYPFPWTSTEVDLVMNTPGLSDAIPWILPHARAVGAPDGLEGEPALV